MTAEPLSPEQVRVLNRAVHLLAVVSTEAHAAREATRRRDEAVRLLRADGVSLRAIGAAADLSHGAVAKIAAKEQT